MAGDKLQMGEDQNETFLIKAQFEAIFLGEAGEVNIEEKIFEFIKERGKKAIPVLIEGLKKFMWLMICWNLASPLLKRAEKVF